MTTSPCAMTEEPAVIMVTRCWLPTCHLLRLLTLMMHEITHPDRVAPTFMPAGNVVSSHYPLGHIPTWRGVINEKLISPRGMGHPWCPGRVKLPFTVTLITTCQSFLASSLSHLGEPPPCSLREVTWFLGQQTPLLSGTPCT